MTPTRKHPSNPKAQKKAPSKKFAADVSRMIIAVSVCSGAVGMCCCFLKAAGATSHIQTRDSRLEQLNGGRALHLLSISAPKLQTANQLSCRARQSLSDASLIIRWLVDSDRNPSNHEASAFHCGGGAAPQPRCLAPEHANKAGRQPANFSF